MSVWFVVEVVAFLVLVISTRFAIRKQNKEGLRVGKYSLAGVVISLAILATTVDNIPRGSEMKFLGIISVVVLIFGIDWWIRDWGRKQTF